MPQNNPQQPPPSKAAGLRKLLLRRRALAAAGAVAALALLLFLFQRPSAKQDYGAAAFTVRRSDLVISVLEPGSLASTNAQEIKSGVDGQTTILSVCPDGYMITPQDVKDHKVLMELDSSLLSEQAIQQDITYQDAAANLAQAQEQLDVQKNQNESNISAANLTVEFAGMDLEKYFGPDLAAEVLANKVDITPLTTGKMLPPAAAKVMEKLNVAGAAWQTWEGLKSAIELAQAGFYTEITSYQWSRRLGPQIAADDKLIADADQIVAQKLNVKWPDATVTGEGYIQRTDVETDALNLETKLSAMNQAELALNIFLQYDFARQAATYLSAYKESVRNLVRVNDQAQAALVMAESNLKTRQESLKIQESHNTKIAGEIAACKIEATHLGMVIYASTMNPWRHGQPQIAEGTTVWHFQNLLYIPDASAMQVDVRVHEASIDKVKEGQRVKVVMDAFPDKTYWGDVTKVARMPEIPNWMSPDLKVYPVTVALKDTPPALKPGMSAQAQIMVDTVNDALLVPIQAVSNYNGRRICYALEGDTPAPKVVETGQFNDEFIQIVKGLAAGDRVLLHQPAIPDAVLAKLVPKAPEKPAAPAETAAATKNEAGSVDPPGPANETKPAAQSVTK